MNDGFLYFALIFLTAAVLVVPLAKRSGLGTILGYLLAGIAIGPFGLKLITNPDDILHFAEFGVVMMLFLIGLELQPKILWRLRKPILGLGSSQMILTTILITGAALLFGQTFAVSLAIGLGLALSSTAIVIQLMQERHLLPTHTGQSTFSVLLFQDIAVIPILAAIPLLASMGNVQSFSDAFQIVETQAGGSLWEKALSVLGLVAFLVLIGHYAIRHILHYIAKTNVREIFTAFALLLVIGVTFLMKSIGLSPALGAFIAGVILAESEYRHEIEAQIEPFKALLIGLFFISVGMSINFDIFISKLDIIIMLVGLLVAIKFAVLSLLARLYKFDLSQNILFATLLAQGGEFAFVIFAFAASVNLFNPELTSILNVTVAISMGLTPILILIHDKVLARMFKASFTDLDTLPERPNAVTPRPVLIAGYGRFGQIIGRLLQANGIKATILDHDPKQIDFLRQFGWKVYYGDVIDMEIMRSAGADTAKIIVLAIDDREKAIEVTARVKEKFPHLKILARAYDRRHAYDLTKAGADYYIRETFGSALMMGEEILKHMGMSAFQAKNLARKFGRHDIETLKSSFEHFDDEKALVSFAIQSREELIKIFEEDRKDIERSDTSEGWDGKADK